MSVEVGFLTSGNGVVSVMLSVQDDVPLSFCMVDDKTASRKLCVRRVNYSTARDPTQGTVHPNSLNRVDVPRGRVEQRCLSFPIFYADRRLDWSMNERLRPILPQSRSSSRFRSVIRRQMPGISTPCTA